jgi:adenine-specific DNA-methyltransferase
MTTDPAGTAPASANFEKLKAKLRELFELDKADLDFGIYRVLRARHREITGFLDKHLERTVREALQSHGDLHQTQLKEDLRKAEQAAKDAGINPDQAPRVLEIREKLKSGNDLDALADEVYSHLYTFFSRYYQEGDFLGLHRSTIRGREKYMLPYNGEEVKLVWANMDQYYIKSSELLRDYTFQITPGEGTLLEGAAADRFTVHFKLVEADTEKDNRKPNGKATRAFALDDEKPFSEDDPATLTIHFRYREHPAERNLQEKLNADTEKTLADNLPAKWKAVLFAPDPSYQGKEKKDTRTLLQKHLRGYTARHQFDYFIHKDLGGFLRRELDFYIKNEVMYLDDIEDLAAPKAEEYLSKIRALRRCALPVIRMLAQLEDFQKKLWLKKKFVVETRYCMTLDRVPEALYAEIAANDAQREEWVKLYAINEIKEDMVQPGYSEPLTVEFLKANPYMMVDTRHFGREFTLKLLASVENLDESLDGVCFHSENFQALQLMQERYREQVKCVYIDPPYNSKTTEIAYKNNYKHSSWAALMQDRLALSRRLVLGAGSHIVAIDENEQEVLGRILANIFGDHTITCVSVIHNKKGIQGDYFSYCHEFAYFCLPPDLEELSGRPIPEAEWEWDNLRKWGRESERLTAKNCFYPIFVRDSKIVGFGQVCDEDEHPGVSNVTQNNGTTAIYPIDSSGVERKWRYARDSVESIRNILRVHKTREGELQIQKARTHANVKTVWDDSRYIAGDYGTTVLTNMAIKPHSNLYPKSVFTVSDSIFAVTDPHALVVDYFGGSGTTGHALIALNREHNSRRKYVLVEMGEYFDGVLVPRLKKVVYSTDWKDGKPENRNTGISHAFKIVRLEGYEDALNNLRLKRTPEQEAALKNAPEKARDDYLLGYFLDVESAGSASLLDLDQFRDPFAYKLKIATSTVGETKETVIDLVETFNWLLGLKVKHIDAQKGFLTVTGEKRAGGRTLVIWRTLSDDPLADNKALEAFLAKIKVNPADTEFDYIYVNGSHTLTDPHNKVHLTEEAFQRLMFDTPDFGMEA